MLTKDQVICRINGKKLSPRFLSGNDTLLCHISEELIAAVNADIGLTRAEVEEEMARICAPIADRRLSAGLRKTLEDRLVFTNAKDLDYSEERRKLFLESAKRLQEGALADSVQHLATIRSSCHSVLLEEIGLLYADLPGNDHLLSVKPFAGPDELIQRYNIGLVQGILLSADRIDMEFVDASPAKLRRLFAMSRFTRLIMDAHQASPRTAAMRKQESVEQDETPLTVQIAIDGPESVLEQSRSYGFQLALFFPVVCGMEQWSIKARLKWSNIHGTEEKILELNQTSGLRYLGQYGAYVPAEISAFQKTFNDQSADWKLHDEIPFLKCPKGVLIFPDLAFKHPDGRVVYLELFHRWHSRQLAERLSMMEKPFSYPLAIGVDRSLVHSEQAKQQVESSSAFAEHGFLYRDFPTVDKVIKCLNSFKNN